MKILFFLAYFVVLFDVLTYGAWDGAFLNPILTGCQAPTNQPQPQCDEAGSFPSVLCCHALQLKDIAARHLQEKIKNKNKKISKHHASYLFAWPVTKPWPPCSYTDYSRPGRNNQHTRGKRRTPRLPLDQNQCTC